MKYFLDTTADLWADRFGRQTRLRIYLYRCGGQESTLLTMMRLLHHGMLIQGLPYSLPALNQTRSGAYGVTHLQGSDDQRLSEEEAS